jgi:RNA polymerase sigma factor (TIGR02999 family)
MARGLPKKSMVCGPADGILSGCLGGGEKTRRLNRFDAPADPRFRIPRQELGEAVPPGPSSLSVPPMSEVTRILSAIEQGDPRAAEQLLPLVYDELRKLAAHKLAEEQPGQTLQATALVHEAYLRLVDVDQVQHWDSRGHFFAAAAEAMRRILIDQARRKQSQKRGGGLRRVELDAGALPAAPQDRAAEDLLALDEALQQLETEDALKARLVKLRYFAGLSLAEAAAALGISAASAKRHWVYARSWLYGKVHGR